MSRWLLPTATTMYVVEEAPAAPGFPGGLVAAGWARRGEEDGVPRWVPPARLAFETLADVTPLELTAAGTRHVQRSDLLVTRDGGGTGALLALAAVPELETDGPRTSLTAEYRDETGGLRVVLHLESDTRHDAVARWAEIENLGTGSVELSRAFGGAWELDVGPGARVHALAGRWSREFQQVTVDLPAGTYELGSRTGTTSHGYSPVVTLEPRSQDGPAHGVALGWSGSWAMTVDAVPERKRVRVGAGWDDETTVVVLGPGESMVTPRTYVVRAADRDGVTRALHHFQRLALRRPDHADRGREYHHPIVYNSWYATEFDVRLEHQAALARQASELGAEVFVVDDGWFRGRDSDRAGLGDWEPDPGKFPAGLGPLIDTVRGLGMRFGLWVEPEAVSRDSDLFRAHPDWVYCAAGREPVTVRNQLVLDLGRPEVEDFVAATLRRLLTENDITYLKWDMNRPVSDGGRAGDVRGRSWSIDHTRAYYRLMDLLRREFPHVTVEACSGGGGRIDLEVLARSDVVWVSDETGPRDRLAIQHGFLTAYAPEWIASWVTDEPDLLDAEATSFGFRWVVAMAGGAPGIGGDVLEWSADRRDEARRMVALAKTVRPTILDGDVTVHGTPADPVYAVQYSAQDEAGVARAMLLAYGRGPRDERPPVPVSGLDAGARYRWTTSDGAAGAVTAEEAADGLTVSWSVGGDADVVVLARLP